MTEFRFKDIPEAEKWKMAWGAYWRVAVAIVGLGIIGAVLTFAGS